MTYKEPTAYSKPYLAAMKYDHLPPKLQAISKPFCELAWEVATNDELDGIFVTKALDHLLYAKDAAVRAAL